MLLQQHRIDVMIEWVGFYVNLISTLSRGNLTINANKLGHSRKHPYHTHGGNWKLTPLPPSDVLIHLLLS